jgi:hypothetical protein
MAVLLTDSSTQGKPDLYLGQKAIRSRQLEPNAIDLAPTTGPSAGLKPAPVVETFEFPIPLTAKIRKFNEITVMLLSDGDIDSAHVGPKIAVRQFQVFPR